MASWSSLIFILILRLATSTLSQQWSEEGLLEELPLPCSCKSLHELLDLGHNYFPRYIPSRKCILGTCWRGPYHCVERTYKVKVLKQRNDDEEEQTIYDSLLPESLRTSWKFEAVPVTVACECSP